MAWIFGRYGPKRWIIVQISFADGWESAQKGDFEMYTTTKTPMFTFHFPGFSAKHNHYYFAAVVR